MVFFLVFLGGMIVQNVVTPKSSAVAIENGKIVAEVKNEGPILVIKNGDNVEMRKVLQEAPKTQVIVESDSAPRFHRDAWGSWVTDCATCHETVEGDREPIVWQSNK